METPKSALLVYEQCIKRGMQYDERASLVAALHLSGGDALTAVLSQLEFHPGMDPEELKNNLIEERRVLDERTHAASRPGGSVVTQGGEAGGRREQSYFYFFLFI